ncbi:MAG: SMP-30/gluconolactonase/LRE family protein [Candidatus Cybelea sp.]
MSRYAGIVGTIFGAVFVAVGCSPVPLPSGAGVGSPALTQPTRTALIDRGPFLYIGGSKISMYRLGSTKPMRTVSSSLGANVFALDSAGELLAGSGSISWGALTVYDARTLGLIRTDTGIDGTSALAVDAQDYVYDATCGGAITVFTPGVSKIVGEIRRGARSVCSMGFDGSGALYAANVGAHSVSVLVSTGRPGKWRLERRIGQGTNYPKHILVKPSGRLFVANNDSVSVYAPGSSSPERVIRNGIERATAVAVDSKGRLYVASSPFTNKQGFLPGWISVYAPGQTQPLRKITDGVDVPSSLAIDPNDNLYVADSYGDAVTAYSGASGKLLYAIKRGVSFPSVVLVASP